VFLIVSGRSEFVARWRLPFERVGGFVAVRPSLAEAGDVSRPWMMVVDVAGLPAGWAPPDPALAAVAGSGRILLAGRDFTVDEELKALGSGISGCCAESLGELELKNVVEVVLKGGIWVSRGALPPLLGRLQGLAAATTAPTAPAPAVEGDGLDARWARLTGREKEIARQVAEGASNKVIARKLDISDATIKAHLTSVYSKLGVAGRLQLGLLLSGKVGRLP
jgi:DNA-binding NarL/FixJ family response regulator